MPLLGAVPPDGPVPPLILAAFRDHTCKRSQTRGTKMKTALSHLGPRLLIPADEDLPLAYALYVLAVFAVMVLVALSLL